MHARWSRNFCVGAPGFAKSRNRACEFSVARRAPSTAREFQTPVLQHRDSHRVGGTGVARRGTTAASRSTAPHSVRRATFDRAQFAVLAAQCSLRSARFAALASPRSLHRALGSRARTRVVAESARRVPTRRPAKAHEVHGAAPRGQSVATATTISIMRSTRNANELRVVIRRRRRRSVWSRGRARE